MIEKQPSRFFYGYIIVLLGFSIIVVGSVAQSSFGVFFEPLLTEFKWTRAITSGAMSISALVSGIFNIVTGKLSDKFGPRFVIAVACLFSGAGMILLSRINAVWQLYACFGILAIGGTGFLIPMVATVAKWFVKRRGIMTSILISAHGTCEMIVPPLSGWMIMTQGWRQSYFILGVSVIGFILIASQFIRREPGQEGLLPYGESLVKQENQQAPALGGYALKEALHFREFWILGAILFCLFFGHSFIYTHIVIHATGLGISRTAAVNIISIIGGTYIVSLNVSGTIADRIGKRPVIAFGFLLVTIVFLGLIAAKELWMLYLLAFIFGFGRGSVIAPMPPLVADIFGLKSLGVITGSIFFGLTVSMVVGPMLTGYIFDVTESYFLAFVTCGSIAILGFMLTFLVRPPSKESA